MLASVRCSSRLVSRLIVGQRAPKHFLMSSARPSSGSARGLCSSAAGSDRKAWNSREVTTADGVRLAYDDLGDENATEVLLFIPGALGFAASDFGPQRADLSGDFRVLAPDPRGCGRSRPPRRDFPTDFMRRDARDAAAVVEHALGSDGCGGGRVTVCGWSDGANSAVLFAAERPDLTKRVVMWGGNSAVTQADLDLCDAAADTSQWSARMAAPLLEAYGAEGLQSMWTAWIAGIREIHRTVPGGSICRDEAKALACPVLLLHGDKDPMVPSFHPKFYRDNILCPLQYHHFPDGKHNIHLRYADEFNALIRKFCADNPV